MDFSAQDFFGGNGLDMDDEEVMMGGYQEGPVSSDAMFAGMKEGYDSYGILDATTKKTTGRYISKTPSGAAKKAARRILKESGKKTVSFMIRKTTRGSKRDIYRYSAVLEVLRNPIVVKKGDAKIVIKNKISVKSEDLPDSVVALVNRKKDAEKEKMMRKKEAAKAKKAKAAEKAREVKEKKAAKAKAAKAKKAKAAEKGRKPAKKAAKKGRKAAKKMMGGSCGGGYCNMYV